MERVDFRARPLIFIKGSSRPGPFMAASGVMEEGMLHCRKLLLAAAVLIAATSVAGAQGSQATPAPEQATPSSPPPAAPAFPEQAAPPAPEQALLKPAQLDALVAPIALYPDPLLANVMAAATYPLEVVQA